MGFRIAGEDARNDGKALPVGGGGIDASAYLGLLLDDALLKHAAAGLGTAEVLRTSPPSRRRRTGAPVDASSPGASPATGTAPWRIIAVRPASEGRGFVFVAAREAPAGRGAPSPGASAEQGGGDG